MSRSVGPEQRRTDLAEAVWRVVRREGLEGASVRGVAREAGLSMGSLRHYFGTQSELLVFAMRMIVERIERRVAALQLPSDPREAAVLALSELLPLDPERAAENQVWLAFSARAMVDSEFRALRDESYTLLRSACHRWVLELIDDERSSEDTDLETERLFALLDGLAVHAAMRPSECTPHRQRAVLRLHLDRVAAGRQRPPDDVLAGASRRQAESEGRQERPTQ
jgi:AcrR family transcriptional regulator